MVLQDNRIFNDKFYIIKKLPKDRKFIFHKTYFQKLRFHDIYDLYNDERFCKYSIFALNKFLKKNKKYYLRENKNIKL